MQWGACCALRAEPVDYSRAALCTLNPHRLLRRPRAAVRNPQGTCTPPPCLHARASPHAPPHCRPRACAPAGHEEHCARYHGRYPGYLRPDCCSHSGGQECVQAARARGQPLGLLPFSPAAPSHAHPHSHPTPCTHSPAAAAPAPGQPLSLLSSCVRQSPRPRAASPRTPPSLALRTWRRALLAACPRWRRGWPLAWWAMRACAPLASSPGCTWA